MGSLKNGYMNETKRNKNINHTSGTWEKWFVKMGLGYEIPEKSEKYNVSH